MLRFIAICFCLVEFTIAVNAQNIGLHTTSPDAPIHMANSGQVNTPGGFLLLGNRDEGNMQFDFNILQSMYGVNPLDLQIQPFGGRVGINTPSPVAPLHVASSGEVNTPSGVVLIGSQTNGHMKLDFNTIQSSYGPTSDLDLSLQPEGGHVGVNTMFPAAPLHVSSGGLSNTPNGLLKLGSHVNKSLELDFDMLQSKNGASNYNTLRIQPDGGNIAMAEYTLYVDALNDRVGIGDITPSHALDVNGSIDVLDFIFHKGETDTYMGFLTDRLRMVAGGSQFIDMMNTTQDYINFGNGGDIDINMNSGLFFHGLNKQIGIGSAFNTPMSRLHIKANEGESAFQVQTNDKVMIEVESDRDIKIGNYLDPEEPVIRIYQPIEYYNPFVNQPGLTLDGPEISFQNPTLVGGYINVGAFGQTILMDADEIQSFDNTNDIYSDLHINQRGGEVIFGAENGVDTQVGINAESPVTDLHVKHFGPSNNNLNGIRLEYESGDFWRMAVHSNGDFEMYYENPNPLTPKAVLSHVNGGWTAPSDSTLKKDIQREQTILEKVNQLNPVTYHMKNQDASEPVIHGFIAQEVKEIFPELVTPIGDKLGLQYEQFNSLAIQSIKELTAKNDALEDKVKSLEERLSRMEAMLVQDEAKAKTETGGN